MPAEMVAHIAYCGGPPFGNAKEISPEIGTKKNGHIVLTMRPIQI